MIDEQTLRAAGRLSISEANEILEADLPEDEWDTVGGLIVGLLGRIPEEGEAVECNGIMVVAERVEGHRVLTVRMVKEPGDTEPATADLK